MAEWFALITEEETNLLVGKAVPENTKKSTSYTLKFLTVICTLSKCSNTQASCEIFACLQPSLTLFNSLRINNMTKKKTCYKTKSLTLILE